MRVLKLLEILSSFPEGDSACAFALLESAQKTPAKELAKTFEVALRCGELGYQRATSLLVSLREIAADSSGGKLAAGDPELARIQKTLHELEALERKLTGGDRAKTAVRNDLLALEERRSSLQERARVLRSESEELRGKLARLTALQEEVRL